jgi:hypothetical protein
MRCFLLYLIVFNLLCAVCVYPLVSLATGAGKLYIVSTYRELDLAGLINHEALKTFEQGRLSEDWRSVPDELGEGAFWYVKVTVLIVAAAFALNSLLMVLLVLPAVHTAESTVPGTDSQFNQ